MKRVIGLIPLVDDERASYWMLPGYMEGIEAAGGLAMMLPLTTDREDIERLCALCDGFLLTGGHDVSPEVYGAARTAACGACSPRRDAMERAVLDYALAADEPVLGICRGIQFINAALGGTLYQDLPTEHPSKTEHHQNPPYDVPVHGVRILEGTPLRTLLEAEALRVNSYHHQAIRTLAPCLTPMAVSEDGLIEAVCLPEKRFVWGVQWHPEFAYRSDASARKIFSAFVCACSKEKTK